VRARLGAIELLATATGSGPRRAGAGVQRLLDTQPVTLLIGIGIGGALDPALEVGHLVVAARTRERQGPSLAPDPAWRRRAEALGARSATLVTVPAPVLSAGEKAALLGTLPATERPAVVDMESHAWARAASERGIPWLVLRAISDGAREDLPGWLAACVDPDGGLSRAAAAWRALLDPASWPQLRRLRRRLRVQSEALAALCQRLIEDAR